jgi:hypothetical protein
MIAAKNADLEAPLGYNGWTYSDETLSSNGYSDFFTSSDENACPITDCVLMEFVAGQTSTTVYSGSYLTIDPDTGVVTASVDVSDGWSSAVNVKCTYGAGAYGAAEYQGYGFTVTQAAREWSVWQVLDEV